VGSASLEILGKEVCRIRTGLAGSYGYSKVSPFRQSFGTILTAAQSCRKYLPMLSLLSIYFEWRKLSKHLFLYLRKLSQLSLGPRSFQSTSSQGYTKGKTVVHIIADKQEAIKDSSPADVNEDDEAEVAEAEEEGGVKELAVKTKHKTKQHIMSLFRHGGKKAAGVAGDVSVDGRGKRVSYPDYVEMEADYRSVPRLTNCYSVVVCQMMGILGVSFLLPQKQS
jgi:hypothetical protein